MRSQKKNIDLFYNKNSIFNKIKIYIEAESNSLISYIFQNFFTCSLGWIPGITGIGLRNIFYKIFFKKLHKGVSFENNIRIKGARYIEIGEFSYFNSNIYLHGTKKYIKIGRNNYFSYGCVINVLNFTELENSFIEIGDSCYFGEYSILRGQGGLKIGNNVLVSPYTAFYPNSHIFKNKNIPFNKQGTINKGITVGDNVWIGSHSIILDGSDIGNNCIIGAGSVVKGKIPNDTMYFNKKDDVIKKMFFDENN